MSENKDTKPKKKGGAKLVLAMTVVGCLVPFGVPTLIVCAGLLPTLVALLTDTDSKKSSLASVGYMNLAGVLPFLIDLWQKGQTMEVALGIVRDPWSWVVMLGAAGLGHLILYVVPPLIASVVLINQAGRLRVLREGLKELEAIWGPEVGASSSPDATKSRFSGGG